MLVSLINYHDRKRWALLREVLQILIRASVDADQVSLNSTIAIGSKRPLLMHDVGDKGLCASSHFVRMDHCIT